MALQLGRDPVRANHLIAGIATICTAYAAYGLIAFAAGPGSSPWLRTYSGPGFVSSTFYNRNNFATYAGMGTVIILALLLTAYGRAVMTADSLRLGVSAAIETTARIGGIHLCALFIAMAALLLTGSRGGIISALFGVVVLVALTFGQARRSAIGQRGVLLLIVIAVLAIFAEFGDTITHRIAEQGFGDDQRLEIYKLTLGSIADQPFFGYGYGTFADVFPMFRDRSVDTQGVWLMAHNTYLEVYQGLGLLFGSLLIAAVGVPAFRCMTGATKRKINATIPRVAGAVTGLIALNALVDFSLQIQAVTLTFMAILGAGTAQASSSRMNMSE